MKLAIIDINLEYQSLHTALLSLVMDLQDSGIDSDIEKSYDLFMNKFGGLEKYDGVLLHLGVKNQSKLGKIINEYKNTPMSLLSFSPTDYDLEEHKLEIPCFNYQYSLDEIKKWLEDPKNYS